MGKKLTAKQYIEEVIKIHKGFYKYDRLIYKNANAKIEIWCPRCKAYFWQKASAHKGGHGCLTCSNNNRQTSLNEFKKRANIIHNNKYNYEKSIYTGVNKKLIIICPEHGEFEQTPGAHLRGSGCIKCATEEQRIGKEEFISRANIVHHNKYDYSLVNYSNNRKKVKIFCPKCKKYFLQCPFNHLKGHGCPQCVNCVQLTTEIFIERANILHNNYYDYSLVNYKTARIKVKIICPVHGIFEQIPYNHLMKKGCPRCSKKISKGEREVLDYIKTIYVGEIKTNDRRVIRPKEIDIYLPGLKIGIEYNGEYWHSKHEANNPGYHFLKEQCCKKAGIELINIWENDWKTKNDEVKMLLKERLR